MRVGSLFSGIGGTDLALERAGMRVVFNCEIDDRCRSVLRHHWPGTPRFKDVKTVTGRGLGAAGLRPDCLAGGFPCQDLSVAGARAGLAGERSGLFFEFARILAETKPRWFLLENVPGLLSSHRGGDMGVLLSTLVNIGYGVAWRVLDAQYFGVAQRRRRVFVVGCLGDAARAQQVLLVGEGGGGDPPARRAAGQDVAGTLGGGSGSRGWAADLERMTFVPEITHTLPAEGDPSMRRDAGTQGFLVPAVSHALCAPSTGGPHNDHNGETLLPVAFRKATTSHGPDNDWERWEEAEHTNTLDVGSNVTRNAHAVVQPAYSIRADAMREGVAKTPSADAEGRVRLRDPGMGVYEDVAPTVDTGQAHGVMGPELAVRRLTPLECLRLQGFPDDWLDGLGLPDSAKYRMVGNAVAVPVVAWIARRMMEVDRG